MPESRRVVWRYYAYLASKSNGFYLPVGLLYLQQEFGWHVVGLTQGVFALVLLAAELPTGYLGDRVGRRASLAAGNALSAFALGAFVFLDTPVEFVALYAVWAVGWAFRSGSGEAWLYEVLAARGERDEYARASGRGSTVLLATSAVTAVLAGVLATHGIGVPLFANAALSALGIPLALSLPAADGTASGNPDTNGDANAGEDAFAVRDALRTLRAQLSRPDVRWIVAYTGCFHVLFAVTRPYESPIAQNVGVPVAALGLLFAGFKLASAGAAATAGWFRDALGTRRTFALFAPVYGLAYAAVAFAPALVVPVFFLNRSAMKVLRPLRDQYVNDRVGDVGRATVLSGVSMALSLASGTANLASGLLVDALGPYRFLAAAGVLLAGLGGVLWVAVTPVREPAAGPGRDGGAPAVD